ncbi:amidohydrolase family protein [Pelagibacterium montanilacus]|uniref:amidohydrolase family protein n=1 Tax=Pelagibacterium montanilacus TaxID=2185280 RepID=UPI000F8EAD86|nr:amidohydrolase family protein [Pelagibacterium montanilacus]
MIDLIVRNAHLRDRDGLWDIGISGQSIAAIERRITADARIENLEGRLVLPGFCDTHVHLDKACLLGRSDHRHGALAGAIAAISRLKAGFTAEDVYARGARCLEMAIVQGTTHMRTHVEIDPVIGLRAFEAIRQLRDDYRWALDLSICVFPQEGLLNNPGTDELMVMALEGGADLVGGCPYTDSDPHAHVARIFDLAERFDIDIDFHLDFDLDPGWMHLDAVLAETRARERGGRVAVGHATKLSALAPAPLAQVMARLADAGVAVTALPATDLYLMGRDHTENVPRGVAPVHRLAEGGVCCSIATNNVLNPFTPFGDFSLLRMANLYANVCHAGPDRFAQVLDLITTSPARLLNLPDYGTRVGAVADLVVLDAPDQIEALGALAMPLFALKRGRKTFARARPELMAP